MSTTIRVRAGVAAGLVALAALACWRLDRTSLWVDEVFSLAATNKLGLSLRSTKGTMGAYYVALWLWAKVSTATWWLRLLSTVGAATSVVAMGALARSLLPRTTAWVAPLALVGVPIFAWTAVEARAYAWETALTITCWIVFLRALDAFHRRQGHERRWWAILTVLFCLGPFLHGLFILQVPAFVLVAFVSRRRMPALLARLAPACLAALVPTALIASAGGTKMGATWAGTSTARVRVLWQWLLSPMPLVAILLGVLVAVGVVATLEALAASTDPLRRARQCTPAIWLFTSLVAAMCIGPFAPYYLAPTVPAVVLLMLRGARRLTASWSMLRLPGDRRLPVLAIGVLALLALSATTRPIARTEDWRGAARLVAAHLQPGDVIVFAGIPGGSRGTGSTRLGIEAAWREVPHTSTPRTISHTRQLGLPQRVDEYRPLSSIAADWAKAPRVWVVDYLHQLPGSGLLDQPAIKDHSCAIERRSFAGGIDVALYVPSTAAPSCPPS